MSTVFSDDFKIITNMNIFQYDELSKNTNLKLPQCRKRKKTKRKSNEFLKKSTLDATTNDDKNEKPTQHKRMRKNILFFKKRYKREKKSHLSFTKRAALHPAPDYAYCVSKPTDDYLEGG